MENAPRGKPEGRDFPGDFKMVRNRGGSVLSLKVMTKSIINEGRGQLKRKADFEQEFIDPSLHHRFAFRYIRPEEADQAAKIEEICFPPNEACSAKMMKERVAAAPDFFLVAADRETGRLAGFLNGLATDEEALRDEFFKDAALHDPKGRNIMLLGLDVLPAYRGTGAGKRADVPVSSPGMAERERDGHPDLPGRQDKDVWKKWALRILASPAPYGEENSGMR